MTIFSPQGVRNLTKPGLHGGVISSIVLALNISHDVNGVTYTCQASNPALQRSVNDAVQLNVMCKYGYFITGGSSSSSSDIIIHSSSVAFCFKSPNPALNFRYVRILCLLYKYRGYPILLIKLWSPLL